MNDTNVIMIFLHKEATNFDDEDLSCTNFINDGTISMNILPTLLAPKYLQVFKLPLYREIQQNNTRMLTILFAYKKLHVFVRFSANCQEDMALIFTTLWTNSRLLNSKTAQLDVYIEYI